MTSTSFNVGLNTATRNSSKVLKPPGGGSSDIFGSSGDSGEPQRGRRNHNISSFSLGGEEVATPARKPDVAPVIESISSNGSTSSTESTPAPTPTPPASSAPSAPPRRVPPGGFSSGLW